MSHDWFTPEENARRTTKRITEPWILTKDESVGGVLTDLDVLVPSDFHRVSPEHAVTSHIAGLKVRNCRIIIEVYEWQDRWQLPDSEQPADGVSKHVDCLAIPEGSSKVDIDGLHVEGSPHVGLSGLDVWTLSLKRFSATRCHYGAHFSKRTRGCRWFDVNGVRVWGQWGPPPYHIGADGWVSDGDYIKLRDFSVEGPVIGAKICGPGTGVTVENFEAAALMLQGKALVTDPGPGLQVAISGLYLNAGYGPVNRWGHRLTASWGVQATINGGYIMGAGLDGDGISASGDVHLDVRGVTFAGHNARSHQNGPQAAALCLDVREPVSTVNADFETANLFTNQQVKIRRAA